MPKLAESVKDDNKNVMLDGNEISAKDFNENLGNLSSNKRVVETSENNFTTVERMKG